jgi:D-amino-acid dehydrogenase
MSWQQQTVRSEPRQGVRLISNNKEPGSAPAKIAVVGGGIVGMCAALRLAARGHRVTLYERNGVGRGASYGNASMICVYQNTPLAWPGLLVDIPKMLLNRESPLRIRPSYIPKFVPWGLQFLRRCNMEDVHKSASLLSGMLNDSLEAWTRTISGTTVGTLFCERGSISAYLSLEKFASAKVEADIRRQYGAAVEILTSQNILDMEPRLERKFVGGLYHRNVVHIVDTLKLTEGLYHAFLERGGGHAIEEVRELCQSAANLIAARTDSSSIEYDFVIVAAGMNTPTLCAPFGTKLSLAAERGYHVELDGFGNQLSRPVGIGDAKFQMTPLDGRLRLAGTAEFANTRAPPDWRRAELLLAQARRVLPQLPDRIDRRWMGVRSSTPDSLPAIGATPKSKRVLYACGHGHLGLTLAAKTAEILVDEVERGARGQGFQPESMNAGVEPIAAAAGQ